MRFCYLLEQTEIGGGQKVVYEQAEALQARGHQVRILSKEGRPDWYDLQVPLSQVTTFSPSAIPESDFIVGTFWTTIRPVVESGKGRPIHLCQGYEGDVSAFAEQQSEIESVYRLPIPALTVHEPLTRLLRQRFKKQTYTVGQGINQHVFSPGPLRHRQSPQRILLVGPYEIDLKGVPEGLQALRSLKQKISLQIVRVSSWPFSEMEKNLGIVDEYHFRLFPEAMAALYRSCNVLLGPSWRCEGFGLPVLEAMACGTPVVVSDIPSFRAFSPGEEWTLFFAERNVSAMQQALPLVLNDRTLWMKLRNRGIEIAKHFTFAKVAERIEYVLQTI